MIEIKNLTKKLSHNIILDSINLSVKKGEILGLLGPNGAGKTTTMKIITSFWSPTSGSVKIDGLDTTTNSIATRKKIGYLPETVPLYDEMRVYEYLKFVAEVRGVSKNDIKERIKSVVSSCGLKQVIRKPIEELSKGYRQRVGLAQAIIHEPDILILDEPTTGLDPNQIVEIRELIKRLGEKKTVIFSTHILSEVTATCDRAVIINDGRIVAEGTPDELIKKASGKEIIYTKVKGPKEDVLRILREMENVEEVKETDKEAEEVYGYEITPKTGVDLREYLFLSIKDNGWSMIELYRKSVSLEDVFKDLTN